MADRTAIEWADASTNPLRARRKATGAEGWHCEHASDGCRHCYAEGINRNRFGTRLPFKPGHRDDVEHFIDRKKLLAPLRWRKPRRIFVCSMTDLFGAWVPDDLIDQAFAIAALTPRHTHMVLTKRSARMRAYLSDPATPGRVWRAAMALAANDGTFCSALVDQGGTWSAVGADSLGMRLPWPLRNIWAGVSIEDQCHADARVPDLLATPAAIRWVSAEPLLAQIDLRRIRLPANDDAEPAFADALAGVAMPWGRSCIDLVICGGESGRQARPMHPAWARMLRDDCAGTGRAFYFKQWGAWLTNPTLRGSIAEAHGSGMPTTAWPDGQIAFGDAADHGGPGTPLVRVGKGRAGRLLDGVEHNDMPVAA